jgi:2-hydroxy-6-oxonona-2,4-dienedioate hydrolase
MTTLDVEITERFIELSHGQTRYLEAGAGPAVLLLHGVGFAPAADGWRLALRSLGRGFRVIAPDFVGWGPGGQLEIASSFSTLVDFVREFQDALGLASSDIVGHSMGGWIASLLAYESPERVRRLVLISSGGLLTRPLPAMAAWQPPDRQAIAASFAPLAALGEEVDAHVERFSALAAERDRTARFARIMAHMSEGETRARYNTTRRLAKVSAPTLVVWGTEDEVNPVEMAQRTCSLVPGSSLVLLDGAHHNVPLERPGELHAAILGFLGAAPRRRRSVKIEGAEHASPIPTGCRIDNLIYSSGIFGTEEDGSCSPEPRRQVERMFVNLRRFLEASGASLEDVVRVTLFAESRSIRPLIDEQWLASFPDEASRPARHLMVQELPLDYQVELEVVAVAPR